MVPCQSNCCCPGSVPFFCETPLFNLSLKEKKKLWACPEKFDSSVTVSGQPAFSLTAQYENMSFFTHFKIRFSA